MRDRMAAAACVRRVWLAALEAAPGARYCGKAPVHQAGAAVTLAALDECTRACQTRSQRRQSFLPTIKKTPKHPVRCVPFQAPALPAPFYCLSTGAVHALAARRSGRRAAPRQQLRLWARAACCRMWIACGRAWAACGELAPERPSDPWFVKSPQPYNRDRSMMTDRAMDSWLAGASRRIPPPPACWPAGPGLFPPERP